MMVKDAQKLGTEGEDAETGEGEDAEEEDLDPEEKEAA